MINGTEATVIIEWYTVISSSLQVHSKEYSIDSFTFYSLWQSTYLSIWWLWNTINWPTTLALSIHPTQGRGQWARINVIVRINADINGRRTHSQFSDKVSWWWAQGQMFTHARPFILKRSLNPLALLLVLILVALFLGTCEGTRNNNSGIGINIIVIIWREEIKVGSFRLMLLIVGLLLCPCLLAMSPPADYNNSSCMSLSVEEGIDCFSLSLSVPSTKDTLHLLANMQITRSSSECP